MKWIKPLLGLIFTLIFFGFLNFQFIPAIPFPIGKFFNPLSGFWQNKALTLPPQENLRLPGVREPVAVLWDDRQVPHIFAQNAQDLYFIQGYLTARHRLWQMEFTAFAAAGRLAEVFGNRPGVVQYDRFRRRIGMRYAAERALQGMDRDPASRTALEAFSAGVNAWIGQLDNQTLPLEYKIFDYRPEAWTPLKSALILKYMAWNLTGRNSELARTRTRAARGDSTAQIFYFRKPLQLAPIIPTQRRWRFTPLSSPPEPDSQFVPSLAAWSPLPLQPAPHNGSNNWVVSGKKSASGYPILCNDPHLGLNLPSIWYEVQLLSPEVNVYGVSIPGTPAVIIGFNQEVAWGVTNAGTDVMDWYQIEFRDQRAREYRYEGQWRPTEARVEHIKVRGGATITDTVRFTHHGPVVYLPGETPYPENIPVGAALRWTAHDVSNESTTFLRLCQAANYRDFVEALSHYDCPGQNFVFASAGGDIAIHHSGKFPLRWKGQGRYLSDGRDSAYEWSGFIPREHLPRSLNPRRGALSSANQYPVGPDYPYYLGGKYATFERGARIQQRLAEMERITAADMMDLQQDILDLRARTVLPAMLRHLDEAGLTPAEREALTVLKSWNHEFSRDATAPLLFDRWWDQFIDLLWEDEFPQDSLGLFLEPEDDLAMDLLINDTASVYFDIQTTAEQERRSDILQAAYQKAHEQLVTELGPRGDAWRWGSARGSDILHLARIPGLGRLNLPTSGTATTVNAIKKTHGPSWRMIVETGSPLKAWGIYPGGQSGDPASEAYDQFVDDWVRGNYYELLYLKSPTDIHPRLVAKSIIRKNDR